MTATARNKMATGDTKRLPLKYRDLVEMGEKVIVDMHQVPKHVPKYLSLYVIATFLTFTCQSCAYSSNVQQLRSMKTVNFYYLLPGL